MIVVGIDPGLTGAIAVIADGNTLVYDMPTFQYSAKGFVKRAFDAQPFANMLPSAPANVFIERVNAFPGQGVGSMFSLGMSYWGVHSVCKALGHNVTLVEAKAWKNHFGLSKEKDASLSLARKMYPQVDLRLAKHHNRAEALLIAAYGDFLNSGNKNA